MDTTDLTAPWLAALWAVPAQAVTSLWSGRVWRGIRAKAPLSEFLLDVVPDDRAWKAKLGEGLLSWLEERRSDGVARRREHGLNAYLLDLREAFASIHLLKLQDCADALRARKPLYDRWLTPLTISSARDVRLEYWRVLALCPSDASLLPRWVQWVREAGDSSIFHYPARYGSVALRALRALPNDEDDRFNLRVILLALIWRAMDQYPEAKRRSQAINELMTTWREIRALYPRSNDFWASLEGQILASMPTSIDQRRWLQTAVGMTPLHLPEGATQGLTRPSDRRPVLPAVEERLSVEEAIRSEAPARSFEKLRAHLAKQSAYASATGDSYFLIRTLSNLGTKWLRGEALPLAALQSLERMAVDGIDWEPANAYIWSLWTTCLVRQKRFDVAESVMWDMRRRFPENAPCRVELARLLMYGPDKRHGDAEALLREAIGRQPLHQFAQVELARLLMFGSETRYAEAEVLLRKVIEEHLDNEASRIELARLLVHRTSSYSEALALVKTIPRRTSLGQSVLLRLETGAAAAEYFEERWQRSKLEFATVTVEYQPLVDAQKNSFFDERSSGHDPHDSDISQLEREAFRISAKLRTKSGHSSLGVDDLSTLAEIARSSDPGISALAEAHWLWLSAHGETAIVKADLENDYPGSYAVQASAVWWRSSGEDAQAWKGLESRFFNRRAETLALRMLQGAYRRIDLPKTAIAAFENWREALPALPEEEAHREPHLVFQHFLAQQVEQLRVRSDAAAAVEIRLLGDALTTCST